MNELLTKDSDSELDRIPEGWREAYISDFYKLCIGGTPSRNNDLYWGPETQSNNKWISIRDLKGKYISETAECISDLGIKKSNVKLLPTGTVLMSFKLTIGRLGISQCPLYTNEAIVGFLEKQENKVDRDFLYFGLQVWNLLTEVDQAVKGATLNKDKISRILGLFPPLPEQKKIASILTAVDEVIENTQKQIDKLQDLKKATMNELLTKGIGHTEFKDSELGRIPEGWEVKTLDEACSKIQDGTHFSPSTDGNDFKYITSKNIRMGYLLLNNVETISEVEHKKIYKRCDVKKNDLLLTKDGANTGNIAINTLDEEFSLLSSVALLRPIETICDNQYLLQFLMSHKSQNEMTELMSGNAITRLTLTKISNFRIILPPYSEQTLIASILSSIDVSVNRLKSKLHQTKSLKKSLMQDLLTGKVRVMV